MQVKLPTFFFCIIVQITSIHFDQGSVMVPHPAKAESGGEDAYYSSSKLLVIADGVGGWKNKGVNAGIFSRKLCENAQKLFNQNQNRYLTSPKQLIIDSQQQNYQNGSSTMVTLTLSNNTLHTSYIGDSRYILIRNKQIIFEATQQQHSFNFPYQLASPQSKYGFNPNKSLEFNHSIKHNDIIVVGSDGLFDNIFTRQIMEVIYRKGVFEKGRILNKRQLAQYFCDKAIQYGKTLKYTSPFAINAYKNNKLWKGGKLDDTTVIVAQVVMDDEEDSEESSSEESRSSSSSSSDQQTKKEKDLQHTGDTEL